MALKEIGVDIAARSMSSDQLNGSRCLNRQDLHEALKVAFLRSAENTLVFVSLSGPLSNRKQFPGAIKICQRKQRLRGNVYIHVVDRSSDQVKSFRTEKT